MFFLASGVQAKISIASVSVFSETGTENLQSKGCFTPVEAISERLAAPFQYQIRRVFFRTTSFPF